MIDEKKECIVYINKDRGTDLTSSILSIRKNLKTQQFIIKFTKNPKKAYFYNSPSILWLTSLLYLKLKEKNSFLNAISLPLLRIKTTDKNIKETIKAHICENIVKT